LEDSKGLNREYTITDAAAPGGKRKQVWHFPGQAECTLCHTMSANFVLGINGPQLDRSFDYGGVKANQIDVMNKLNLFTQPVSKPFPLPFVLGDKEALNGLKLELVDPLDASANLDQRARSYLHANCAHCHMKWGGGNAFFYLTGHLPLADTGAVNTPPQHGDLGAPGSKVIAPGDPAHSLILKRMSLTDHHRMPRVGSNVVDEDAVKLIDAWIKSLLKK
jgi:mono/diheme cytochrome c family protein